MKKMLLVLMALLGTNAFAETIQYKYNIQIINKKNDEALEKISMSTNNQYTQPLYFSSKTESTYISSCAIDGKIAKLSPGTFTTGTSGNLTQIEQDSKIKVTIELKKSELVSLVNIDSNGCPTQNPNISSLNVKHTLVLEPKRETKIDINDQYQLSILVDRTKI